MKKNLILSLLLLPITLFGNQSQEKAVTLKSALYHKLSKTEVLEITPKALMKSKDLSDASLLHINGKFMVSQKGKLSEIDNSNLCQDLRGKSTQQIKDLLTHTDGYIKMKKYSDGEFGLESHYRLRGGGIFGANAGFWVGKFLTHFVAHGTIQIIGICSGPLYPATVASLEAFLAVPIEGASNAVAIACGIAGGVATGPV